MMTTFGTAFNQSNICWKNLKIIKLQKCFDGIDNINQEKSVKCSLSSVDLIQL